MNERSLEKSQIHDSYHFGILRNVIASVQHHPLENTIHTRQMQANCGRGSLTTWRKHNPMYSTMLSTKRNVTLITLSFKSFHLKKCRLLSFLSTIWEIELKRCNKIFL